MDIHKRHTQLELFESFKRDAVVSLMWASLGFFLLGIMVGLMLGK